MIAVMRFLLLSTCALVGACSTTARPPAAPTVPPSPASAPAVPFLPTDYTAEMYVDYAAMRRSGLLDRIERLPMMGSYLDAMAAAYGCDLDDVQRTRTALLSDPADMGRSLRTVSVVEVDPAATPVAMPEPWQPWELGGLRGHQYGRGARDEVVVRPERGIVVAGERELIAPVLTGPAGGPHPALVPFLAGEGLLMQYAAGTFGRRAHTLTGSFGFFGHDDPDDPCEFLRVRLSEDADGGLVLAAALRYRPGSANLRRTEVDLRAFLDRMLADPEFAAMKPLLGALVIAHDQSDLHIALPLGQPRDAIRTLERAVLGMAAISTERMRR